MPRKNKTAQSVAQNREAQRRSRARRQELIDDLRSRLDEYERRGVAASVEMQLAAQAVNAQNERLRTLLGLHGVTGDDIELYLASPETDRLPGLTTSLDETRHRCKACGRPCPESERNVAISTDQLLQVNLISAPSMAEGLVSTPVPMRADTPIELMPQAQQTRHEVVNKDGALLQDLQSAEYSSWSRLHATPATNASASGISLAPAQAPSPPPDFFNPPEPSQSPQSEPLETSCEVAAEILVQIHNHPDLSYALSALGCEANGGCSVRNTRIFQLMDQLS